LVDSIDLDALFLAGLVVIALALWMLIRPKKKPGDAPWR
jgi:hypothetical protein